jgi:hypothetical protein
MDECVLRNEFAIVEIKKDNTANGVRLMIRDVMSGNSVYLDPLELEALTKIRCHHLLPLLDPSGELGES